MSKIIYPIVVLALVLSMGSCKEQPIVLSHSVEGTDTTYVASPEAPQPKKVLVTELTGVRCPNCPNGAELLEDLNEQNGDALVVVGIHSGILTQPFEKTGDHEKSKFDFRTEDGDAILNQIFGGDPNAKPAACFNRLPLATGQSNPYFLTSSSQQWSPGLSEALGQENPVLINVSVSSDYNAATGKYDIEAKVAYNQEVTGTQRLNLFLTQDSIVDVQETDDPFNQYPDNYVFMNTFRKAITGVSGQPVLDSLSAKEAGRVFIFRTSIEINASANQEWVPEHMNVVAFVSEQSGQDIHVYQSAKTPLVKP